MKNFKTISVALVMFAAVFGETSAQSEAFKVLAKKGIIEVNSGGKSSDWNTLSTGFLLYSADKIRLTENSYISLVHPANSRTVELRKAGTYSVSDLIKQANTKINSVAGKYVSYVGSELSKVKEPVNPGERHQSNMGATGSVERAFGDDVTVQDVTESVAGSAFGMFDIPGADYANTVRTAVSTVRMNIPFPKSSYIMEPSVTFLWHPVTGAQQYFVTLSDEDGRALFEIPSRDTFLTVDLLPYTLEKERCYNWRVSTESLPPAVSGDYCIMQLPDHSFKNIQDTVIMISKEFMEDTPLKAMALGHFYEQNSLFLNAMIEFQKATTMEPEVPEYRLAYARFLTRIGLDEEAAAVRSKD